jgi:hypothetical protein
MRSLITAASAAPLLIALASTGHAQSQLPAAIAAPRETPIATLHAAGYATDYVFLRK